MVEPDPRPRPILGDETALARIGGDVLVRRLELFVTGDCSGGVPVSEDVPVTRVTQIEPLGVATVEPLHEDPKIGARALQQRW
jgi:hypothetical protein